MLVERLGCRDAAADVVCDGEASSSESRWCEPPLEFPRDKSDAEVGAVDGSLE